MQIQRRRSLNLNLTANNLARPNNRDKNSEVDPGANQSARLSTFEDEWDIRSRADLSDAPSQSSRLRTDYDESEMNEKKKKMGVQLGILEKNILCQSKLINRGRQKSKRLNKSGFAKVKDKQAVADKDRQPYFLGCQHSQKSNGQGSVNLQWDYVAQAPKNPSCSVTSITSFDLQQIRKFDQNIYDLYIDLFQHYKHEAEKQKSNDVLISELHKQLAAEEAELNQVTSQISASRGRQKELFQENIRKQQAWLNKIREAARQ